MSEPEEEIQLYLKQLGAEIDRVLLRYDRGEQGMPPDYKEINKSPNVQRYYEEISTKLEEMLEAYDHCLLQNASP